MLDAARGGGGHGSRSANCARCCSESVRAALTPSWRGCGASRMLPGMNGPEIADQVTIVDDARVRAPAAARSGVEAGALEVVAFVEIHASMLRAEVDAVFARTTTAGG